MKPNTTIKHTTRRASTKMVRLALLSLAAKKATELWQSRRQPPSPPSLVERLAGPARVALTVVGVGGAAFFANKKGLLKQIKQKVSRSSSDGQTMSSTGSSVGMDAPNPIQPTEPPAPIVETQSSSHGAPESL